MTMYSHNIEKTVLKIPMGKFYYIVKPFGLRVLTVIFHYMLHDCLEDVIAEKQITTSDQ